jgi:hypothetical protein
VANVGEDFTVQVESNRTLVLSKKKGDKGLIYTLGDDCITLDLGVVPVSGNTKVTLFRPGKKVKSFLGPRRLP